MTGCGSGGYTTPQEVFNAHKKAQAEKDWRMHLAVLTPESRAKMVTIIALSAMAKANEDPEIAKLLKKHGIEGEILDWKIADIRPNETRDAQQRMQDHVGDVLEALDDKIAFYVDAMNQIDKVQLARAKEAGKQESEFTRINREAKLIDLKIEGDTATGKRSSPAAKDSDSQEPIEAPMQFKKIDGGWYIFLP